MARKFFNLAGTAAIVAAFSMAATPVAAAALETPAKPLAISHPVGETSYNEAWDYYNSWGRRRHRGIDAGDVLAGVLILGGIAAVASAASKPKRDTRPDYRERDQDYRQPDYQDDRRDYRRPADGNVQGNGMSNAVDMCVGEVERGNDRVAAVDNASRVADGWRISGQLDEGSGFRCWIDNEGRIREIDLGSEFSYSDAPVSGQYDDEYYARARADVDAPDYVDGDLGPGAG